MSLIAHILHIFADKRPVGQPTYIEVGIVSMQPNERAVETFAEPVTKLRLYAPVLQASFIKLPWIIIHRNIQCPPTYQSHFQTKIHGSSGIVKKIAFYSNLLSLTLGWK